MVTKEKIKAQIAANCREIREQHAHVHSDNEEHQCDNDWCKLAAELGEDIYLLGMANRMMQLMLVGGRPELTILHTYILGIEIGYKLAMAERLEELVKD